MSMEDIWKKLLSHLYEPKERPFEHRLYGEGIKNYFKCSGCKYEVVSEHFHMPYFYLLLYTDVSLHCLDCKNLHVIKDANNEYNALIEKYERERKEKQKVLEEQKARVAEERRLEREKEANERAILREKVKAFEERKRQEEEWLKNGIIDYPICQANFSSLTREQQQFVRKIFVWFERKDIDKIIIGDGYREYIYKENKLMSMYNVNYNGTSYGVPKCMYWKIKVEKHIPEPISDYWNGNYDIDKQSSFLFKILDFLTCKSMEAPDFSSVNLY